MSIADRIKTLIQYPLPHHLLSRGMYWITRIRWKPFKNLFIHQIVRHYQVDMSIAENPDLESYPSFNHFFTRTIKPEARPIASGDEQIACPVDGTVSEAGHIHDQRIMQAKGHDYSLHALVGGFDHLTEAFRDGEFSTIYLSPRDYHRIHMPLAGRLRETVYIPGRLFSVNAATTRNVPGLFARNERLVAIFDTDFGPMAVILVGAIFVAGIESTWCGNYGDKCVRDFEHREFAAQDAPSFEKGEEMGRFNMGSTVILLFGKEAASWGAELTPSNSVKMGQLIGQRQ